MLQDNPLLNRIENRRKAFLGSSEILKAEDHAFDPYCDNLQVCHAAGASKMQELAAVLYFLIKWRRPITVIEFGTNIGISAAWQAAAMLDDEDAILHTYEISPARIQFAQSWLTEEGFKNIQFHNMDFMQALDESIPSLNEVDFVFIDGNHDRDATLLYYDKLRQQASAGAVFVFDDIRWSKGMSEAWKTVSNSCNSRCAIEYAGMGILILN